MRKWRYRETKVTCTKRAGGRSKFLKSGSKLTLLIASLASSGIYASSHGAGMFPGVFISEKDCWGPHGGSRPVLRDQVFGEKVQVERRSWRRGLWPQMPCPGGSEAVSPGLKGVPVCQVCPPGTWSGDVRKAALGCLPTSGPDRNLLFHVSAPSLAPGNPTEACL